MYCYVRSNGLNGSLKVKISLFDMQGRKQTSPAHHLKNVPIISIRELVLRVTMPCVDCFIFICRNSEDPTTSRFVRLNSNSAFLANPGPYPGKGYRGCRGGAPPLNNSQSANVDHNETANFRTLTNLAVSILSLAIQHS